MECPLDFLEESLCEGELAVCCSEVCAQPLMGHAHPDLGVVKLPSRGTSPFFPHINWSHEPVLMAFYCRSVFSLSIHRV